MNPIHCQDCGAYYEARRQDAKYCPSCRLLRILTYANRAYTRSKRCQDCRKLYRPACVPDKRRICGECGEHHETQKHRSTGRPTWIDCPVCKRIDVLPYERVSVCQRCVVDPKGRAVVIAALRRGQARRLRDNSTKGQQ